MIPISAKPLLPQAIKLALAAPPARLRAVETAQGMVWIKQRENLSLRWRLQKGDPARAFEAERQALHILTDAGVPVVPHLLAEGDDYFVTADSGQTISGLAAQGPDRLDHRRALSGAAEALATLHRAGFAHGRPALKDICWNGAQAKLIDFERFSPRRNSQRYMALDLLIFALSSIATLGRAGQGLRDALSHYRAVAPAGVWERARKMARCLRFLVPLTAPIRRLRPHAREFAALPVALALFAD